MPDHAVCKHAGEGVEVVCRLDLGQIEVHELRVLWQRGHELREVVSLSFWFAHAHLLACRYSLHPQPDLPPSRKFDPGDPRGTHGCLAGVWARVYYGGMGGGETKDRVKKKSTSPVDFQCTFNAGSRGCRVLFISLI